MQRALVVLLAINCAVYLLRGAAREAAESIAWFALLVLFCMEASARPHARSASVQAVMRSLRLTASAVVVAAVYAYAAAEAWLDAANGALWIAVVILLETQVRCPSFALRERRAFTAIAALLYGGLALIPFAWLAQREWLAAYDAVLWLAAFGTIEMELWSGAAAGGLSFSHTPHERPR